MFEKELIPAVVLRANCETDWLAIERLGRLNRRERRGLDVPTVSLTPEDAAEHFGMLVNFATINNPASSSRTQQRLGWNPAIPTSIADLAAMQYRSPFCGRCFSRRKLRNNNRHYAASGWRDGSDRRME